MNLDDYKNKLIYPTKADFTITYYYKAGKVVATIVAGKQLDGKQYVDGKEVVVPDGCVTEKVLDEIAYKKGIHAYNVETARLAELFIVDLFHDNGVPDDEFTRAMYYIAYQQGHSSGYSEIRSYFEDIVNLQTLAQKVYGK